MMITLIQIALVGASPDKDSYNFEFNNVESVSVTAISLSIMELTAKDCAESQITHLDQSSSV